MRKSTILLSLLIGMFLSPGLAAAPIRDTAGLVSITFWEATSGVGPYTFTTDSVQLTTRRVDPLSGSNADFLTTALEFYDVFYSDSDGSFNANGEFVTVEAIYNGSGSGLNLAEVSFNYNNQPSHYAQEVVGYIALGDSAIESSVQAAVDGDLGTYTFMGSTSGQAQRLRVTVSPVPVPPSIWLLGSGLIGLIGLARRKKS